MSSPLRILAAASVGGHWIQLLRIANGLPKEADVAFVSNHVKCATMVPGRRFYTIADFSRWNTYRAVPAFFSSLRIVWREKPQLVVTTGAAPGLVLLFAAFCLLKKTVWVDSIANVNHLSLSGRIARIFAHRVYTQWPDLQAGGVCYAGNVIG